MMRFIIFLSFQLIVAVHFVLFEFPPANLQESVFRISSVNIDYSGNNSSTFCTKKGIENIGISQKSVITTDTITFPVFNIVANTDKKIIIASENSTLEISPLSSFNNGLLLEPVNHIANTGISTAFYLKDKSSWSFYTDTKRRLLIDGNGNISTATPLLINNAVFDESSSLRVNGSARVDTSFYLKAQSDDQSFISFNRKIKSSVTDIDDSISPYTSTPMAWALGQNLPVFRLRHPNNVAGMTGINTSIQHDFMILPYQSGTAIEFNGIVECWVGEWSIHKGVYYSDVEGKGNGWGAVSWVGDDVDQGGVRATARNNLSSGGNVNYGELSIEKFGGTANGDFRLRLPSVLNEFHFVYGERGSTNIIAKLNNNGLILPTVIAVSALSAPQKAQITFDSTDRQFKGYNGIQWITFSENDYKTGAFSSSGNGTDLSFLIPHGLATRPTYFTAQATSAAAANISYVSADNTNLIIHYSIAPLAGTANLSWNWLIKQ